MRKFSEKVRKDVSGDQSETFRFGMDRHMEWRLDEVRRRYFPVMETLYFRLESHGKLLALKTTVVGCLGIHDERPV